MPTLASSRRRSTPDPGPLTGAPAVVICRGVCKSYGEGAAATRALIDVDLELQRGEVVALTGPSGSGKSTLLHLLGAMDTASAGSIRVGDHELGALDDLAASEHRGRAVGFVFQAFHLMPSLSVLDNVTLPGRLAGLPMAATEARARSLLERVGLGARLDEWPDRLSGGQQQRVAVARALVNEPLLILADEPTGNLDHVSGGEIVELLVGLGHERGAAVLVATHDPAVTAGADREVRLVDGRTAEL